MSSTAPVVWDDARDLRAAGPSPWGAVSVALLIVLPRVSPQLPATPVMLVLSIVVSKALDLRGRGVDVVGPLPTALPDPTIPDVNGRDRLELLPAAVGVMLLACAGGIGVARSVATEGGYRLDPNRELIAVGGSNLLAGLWSGFVQSRGASQTAAANRAGGNIRAHAHRGRRYISAQIGQRTHQGGVRRCLLIKGVP